MLTSAAVKGARPKDRAYKLFDERGLFLYVAPTGLCSYRLKFRYQKREQLLVLGRHPDLSLTDARARAEAARDIIAAGADPAALRRQVLEEAERAAPVVETFEMVARAWHAHRRPRWSAEHAQDVIDSLELHVFPSIGARALADIDAPAVLDLLQLAEAAGVFETARRLRQRISAVYRYAIAREKAAQDPAAILVGELGTGPAGKHHPALLELDAVRVLYSDITAAPAAPIATLAAQFLALTGMRWAAVRGTNWEEFTDIDWDGAFIGPLRPSWTVPAARMKLAAAKKLDAANDHIVPLSRQAVEILRAARSRAGAGGLVFRGRAENRPLGEAAIGELHARAGYAGIHVPHGWRASFSTIMNERFSGDRSAIDRALGHAPKTEDGKIDKVEAAYNRAQHLGRRRLILQRWADLLCPTSAG